MSALQFRHFFGFTTNDAFFHHSWESQFSKPETLAASTYAIIHIQYILGNFTMTHRIIRASYWSTIVSAQHRTPIFSFTVSVTTRAFTIATTRAVSSFEAIAFSVTVYHFVIEIQLVCSYKSIFNSGKWMV